MKSIAFIAAAAAYATVSVEAGTDKTLAPVPDITRPPEPTPPGVDPTSPAPITPFPTTMLDSPGPVSCPHCLHVNRHTSRSISL